MKQILLMITVVALVGCGKKENGNTGVVNPNKPSPKAVPEKLIADPIVQKAIGFQLDKPAGELAKADLEQVTELNLADYQLTEIPTGLERLTQLKWLNLFNNQLTSVMGLEKLTQLKELGLHYNKLTDVKGLEKLTQLTELTLDGNKLTDVKGLEKLTQLKKLSLGDTQLTNVKGLEKLAKLEELYLQDNPDLTKAQIAELKKALPKCNIISNPTK